MRFITTLILVLMSVTTWGLGGEEFTYKTKEGIDMCFQVTNEENKECQVGFSDFSTKSAIDVDFVGEVTIPDQANGYDVIRIASYAFNNCKGITAISIPESVTTIQNGAFCGCVGLKTIVLRNAAPYSISTDVFSFDVFQRAILYVPIGTKNSYTKANGWKRFKNIVEKVESYVVTLYDKNSTQKDLLVVERFVVPEDIAAVNITGVSDKIRIIPNKNPNTLYYIGANEKLPCFYGNFVQGNHADSITLKEGHDFYVPQTFIAQNICYSRTPTKGVGRGQSVGWETIVLPFDVEKVMEEERIIDWFHSDDEHGKNFWLRKYNGKVDGKISFQNSLEFKANTPYIMNVPDSYWGEEWNLVGKEITFFGRNALLKAYSTILIEQDDCYMVGTMINKTLSNVWVLNDSGSTFAYRDSAIVVKPFCAYFYMRYSDENIIFTDAEVKRICVEIWDINGDGELSKDEARTVSNLGTAFKGNKKIRYLDELQYFEGLMNVDSYSFADCCELSSIKLPSQVSLIGDSAFAGCSNLLSITLPTNVTEIREHAFDGCSLLASIILPSNIKIIGKDVFYGCYCLNSIEVEADVPLSLSTNVFSGISENSTLYVPNSAAIEAYSTVPFWNNFKKIKSIEPNEQYEITIKAMGEGDITCEDYHIKKSTCSIKKQERKVVKLKTTPQKGYYLSQLTLNGSNILSSQINRLESFSLTITEDVTIEVGFSKVESHKIIIQAIGNEKLSCVFSNNTNEYIIENETRTFNIQTGQSVKIERKEEQDGTIFAISAPQNTSVHKSTISYTWKDSHLQSSIKGKNDLSYINQDWIITGVFNDYDFELGDFQFVKTSDSEVSLTNVTCYREHLSIPENIIFENKYYLVSGVGDYSIAYNKAMNTNNIKTLTIPSNISKIGKDILLDNKSLSAIIWNSSKPITDDFISNCNNPNLLLFLSDASYNKSSLGNVIVNGIAEEISLHDSDKNNNFYCPNLFVAKKISYTHNYIMQTGIGDCRGWETIVLPFDVKKITHETKGNLMPFSIYEDYQNAKPFWLYCYQNDVGWIEASNMKANIPYIISMPNHPDYNKNWNIAGKVTFSATDVTINVTDNLPTTTYNNHMFIPSYEWIDSRESINVLNVNNDYSSNTSQYQEGSTFVPGLRAVHPFEAYMISTNGVNASHGLFDDFPTDIPEILFHDPYINKTYDGVYRVCTLSGQLINEIHGKTTLQEATFGLPPGIYLVNGYKVVVK